ncbi:MAG: EamA family transporter [Bacillota bacterium]
MEYHIFWFKALEGLRTNIVSSLLYLTPFVSLLYIWLFLSEKIELSSLVGLGAIVLGVILQYINKKH